MHDSGVPQRYTWTTPGDRLAKFQTAGRETSQFQHVLDMMLERGHHHVEKGGELLLCSESNVQVEGRFDIVVCTNITVNPQQLPEALVYLFVTTFDDLWLYIPQGEYANTVAELLLPLPHQAIDPAKRIDLDRRLRTYNNARRSAMLLIGQMMSEQEQRIVAEDPTHPAIE